MTTRATPTGPLDGLAPGTVETRSGPFECAVLGEGPAVLSLHGAMGGWDQGALLALTAGVPGYRYLCPSRPGYLGTPLADARTPAAQARRYADLLDALGVERAAVMAISGGGPSALRFAVDFPDRCSGAVIFSSVVRRQDQRLPLAWWVLRVALRFPPLAEAMRKRASRDPDAAATRSIPEPDVRARTLAHPEAGPLLRALFASTSRRMAERLDGTENDVAVTRGALDLPLERLQVPVLAVHGTADELAPFENARELVARAPGAELLALDGGRHVAIYTHLEEVRPAVGRFLASHAGAASAVP
ncbi:MAG: alpha/beta hydrolase [Anaeromyxobacteraceae bacterium]